MWFFFFMTRMNYLVSHWFFKRWMEKMEIMKISLVCLIFNVYVNKKISKSQALKLPIHDEFGGEIVDKEAKPILIEVMEFYQLKVEATIEVLLWRCHYIGRIKLVNIVVTRRYVTCLEKMTIILKRFWHDNWNNRYYLC